MSHFASRFAVAAIVLGLLLAVPFGASAGVENATGESGGKSVIDYVPGHRSYLIEDTPPVASRVSADLLIKQLARDGQLTVETMRFIEENVFGIEPALIAGVGTIDEIIQELFDTDHVTVDMILFYEQNVFVYED